MKNKLKNYFSISINNHKTHMFEKDVKSQSSFKLSFIGDNIILEEFALNMNIQKDYYGQIHLWNSLF